MTIRKLLESIGFKQHNPDQETITVTFKRYGSVNRNLYCHAKINGKNSSAKHMQAKVVDVGNQLMLAVREAGPSSPDYSDKHEYAMYGGKFCAELLMRQFDVDSLLFEPVIMQKADWSADWFVTDLIPVKHQATPKPRRDFAGTPALCLDRNQDTNN